MPKQDETTALLREIRDLQREQLALQRAHSELAEHDRATARMVRVARIVTLIIVGALVIGAYLFLYRTIGRIF